MSTLRRCEHPRGVYQKPIKSDKCSACEAWREQGDGSGVSNRKVRALQFPTEGVSSQAEERVCASEGMGLSHRR